MAAPWNQKAPQPKVAHIISSKIKVIYKLVCPMSSVRSLEYFRFLPWFKNLETKIVVSPSMDLMSNLACKPEQDGNIMYF